MLKKLLLSVSIVLLLGAVGVSAQEDVPLFFWGDGCPHCEDAKDELDRLGIRDELNIRELEIYYEESNRELFEQKVEECDLSTYTAGVPLLFYEGNCYIGATPIVDKLVEYHETGTIQAPEDVVQAPQEVQEPDDMYTESSEVPLNEQKSENTMQVREDDNNIYNGILLGAVVFGLASILLVLVLVLTKKENV